MTSPAVFASYLVQSAKVIVPTRSTDEYSASSLVYPDPSTVTAERCLLQQTEATEITTDRDTQVSNWMLFLMPTSAINGDSQVIVSGVTYEVVGPPEHLTSPHFGAHHIEARLRHVGEALRP